MNIYVVRHGKTIWNEQKRLQGVKDSPLTEEGIRQAKLASKKIETLSIDKVYSSPLGRTIETKNYLTSNLNVPYKLVDELKEMNFGPIEGLTVHEATKKHPQIMNNLWNDPLNYNLEGSVTYEMFFERIERALDIITNKYFDNILVVTHGMVIGAMLTILDEKHYKNIWDRPVVKNTSLTTLKYNNNKIEIIDADNIDHLR